MSTHWFRPNRGFPLLFSTIFLYSCTTAVQYPVVEPPEVFINPGVQKMLFVSRFDTSKIEFNKEKVVEVYKQGYSSFIEGLDKGFEATDSIVFNLADTLLGGNWYTFEPPVFNESPIIDLLQRYPTDYLLTLDAFELDRVQEVDVTEHDDGSKSRQAYYDLVITALLSIYDRDGNVVDQIRLDDRQYIDDRSVVSGLLAVGPNIGNFAEVINPLAHDLGFGFAALFFEQEIMVMRLFHSGKVFRKAAQLAANGQWHESEKLLLPLAGHQDRKIAAQAAANLAIVYEALGNYSESMKWQQAAE